MLWQLSLNAIPASCLIALMAVGFSLIYSVSKFFDFSHALAFTSAPYIALLCWSRLGMPLALSFLFGVLSAIMLAGWIQLFLFRRLNKLQASSSVLLLASIGIYVAAQNTISLLFGDAIISIEHLRAEEGLLIFGGRLTSIQLATIVVSILLITAVFTLEKCTTIGKKLRAVASDPVLAETVGINSGRIELLARLIGSALAAVAGLLVFLDVGMTPTLGMNFLMMCVVAAVIGGVGSTLSVATGSLFLGLALNLGVWRIGSEWQQAIAFVILLIFLISRPQGFLGRPLTKSPI